MFIWLSFYKFQKGVSSLPLSLNPFTEFVNFFDFGNQPKDKWLLFCLRRMQLPFVPTTTTAKQ